MKEQTQQSENSEVLFLQFENEKYRQALKRIQKLPLGTRNDSEVVKLAKNIASDVLGVNKKVH